MFTHLFASYIPTRQFGDNFISKDYNTIEEASFDLPEIVQNDTTSIEETTDIPQTEEPTQESNNDSIINEIIKHARSYVGQPYKWGGKNPNEGFDCSGLIGYVYKQAGYDIGSSTAKQFTVGQSVSLENVKPGDIICTPGTGESGKHVKLVSKIENGQIWTIEAKGRKWGIVETPLTNTNNIKSIRRIIGLNNENVSYSSKTSNYGKFSKNDKSGFVKSLNHAYRVALQKHGLNPDYSYILTAQAAMESGWGTAVPAPYNYGGIKATKDAPYKEATTSEWIKGKGLQKGLTKKFRSFKSLEDYCDYRIKLLGNSRYNIFNQFKPDQAYNIVYHMLKNGYGSDYGGSRSVNYANSVKSIYNDVLKILKS